MITAILALALIVAIIFCTTFWSINTELRDAIASHDANRARLNSHSDALATELKSVKEKLRATENNADSLALLFAHLVGELEKKTVINRLPLHFIKLVSAANQQLAKHTERINLRHKPDQLARFDGSPEVPTQNATTTATPKPTRA